MFDTRHEAVLEEDTPAHHPGVVLRAQYVFLRALLAVATAAVAALTVAVVILAQADHEASGRSAAEPIYSINYAGFNPMTGRPQSAPR